MNDDFLYRLRTEPPAHFATALKARLDRAPRRGVQVLRLGLGVLLFGTAFAVVSPAVRHTVVEVVQWIRGGAAPGSSASDVQIDGNRSNKGLARAYGDRSVESPGGTSPGDAGNARDIGDRAGDGVDDGTGESGRRGVRGRAAQSRPPAGLPRVAQSGGDDAAGAAASSNDIDAGAPTGNRLADDRGAAVGRDEPAADSTGFIVTGPLLSEPGTAARAFETRRALFTVMQWTMDSIDKLVTQRYYTVAQAEPLARRIEVLASMLDEQFALDERTQKIETRALHDIWERRAEFTRRANELAEAAHTLATSIRPGDRMHLLRDAAVIQRACTSCHVEFRKGGDKNVGAVYP